MDALGRLTKLLKRLKDESAGKGVRAEFARELVDELEDVTKALGGVRRPARRGTGEIDYLVETTQQGAVLTERRLSGMSEPFRCPKLVYEAIAVVFTEADRSLNVEEIIERVQKKLIVLPRDHQVRVALRFWLSVDPRVLVRDRARYAALSRPRFTQSAQQLWQALRLRE